MTIQKKTEGRDLEEYLQEVWDSLEPAWDKSKFDMKQGYDSEYECDCITITSKDNEGVRAKIYVNDYEGRHPVGFDVVYRYPGDKGVGVMGSYEFQSTDMDGLGEEVFDYFEEIKQKVGESMDNESKKSEGKDDKYKKDDKSCKGKDCKDGKQAENRGKPQEGPGAGYTVTIKDMTISDEPKISKDGDKFIVEAPVEYEADAEGYDWSSAYIMNELVGTDEGTFPHNPFKGVLTMEVKDSPDIWGAMQNSFFADRDNPTEEEKMEILTDVFHKGASFNDFEQSYGGGYTHSKFVTTDDVCMQADYYGFNDIEFGGAADGYASGTLTIDDRFIEDIEYAHDYSSNQYEFVEAIKKFVADRGLEIDWSDEALYDFVASNVPSEVTESDVKEILSDMVDSGVEFTDADGNPADLQLESIQGESTKSEGISDMIDAKLDYNMFMRMCKTAAYLEEDEDYWDALWDFYSEIGDIGDALVFFDNLFQYTAWCDVDEVYDEYLDDKFKDNSKSKEECIDAAIDDGDLQAYKHEKGNYLVIL